MTAEAETDLRVPTATLEAVVQCTDGRTHRGTLFVSVNSSRHTGRMRPGERLNDADDFLPFKTADAEAPLILNKTHVVVMSFELAQLLDAERADGDPAENVASKEQRLHLDCGSLQLEGIVDIESPEYVQRTLDHLNRTQRFLRLRDEQSVHFVNRAHVISAREVP